MPERPRQGGMPARNTAHLLFSFIINTMFKMVTMLLLFLPITEVTKSVTDKQFSPPPPPRGFEGNETETQMLSGLPWVSLREERLHSMEPKSASQSNALCSTEVLSHSYPWVQWTERSDLVFYEMSLQTSESDSAQKRQ